MRTEPPRRRRPSRRPSVGPRTRPSPGPPPPALGRARPARPPRRCQPHRRHTTIRQCPATQNAGPAENQHTRPGSCVQPNPRPEPRPEPRLPSPQPNSRDAAIKGSLYADRPAQRPVRAAASPPSHRSQGRARDRRAWDRGHSDRQTFTSPTFPVRGRPASTAGATAVPWLGCGELPALGSGSR